MKKTSLSGLLSGFQDFLSENMRSRSAVIGIVKQCYEKFGFLPQETPCLEYADLLLGKYGENQKLVYDFHDKGMRHVALRYDLTVPLSRIVRMYGNELAFPYRRYQIGMVWRADKPGKGRYREFMQMDADIVGDNSLLSDVEIILLNIEIMKGLNIRSRVKINTRQVLDLLIEKCELDVVGGTELVRCIDKFDKIGAKGVIGELKKLDFSSKVVTVVNDYLNIRGNNAEIISGLKKLFGSVESCDMAIEYLENFVALMMQLNVGDENFSLEPSIARGLDYYTGIIFETTFLDDPGFGSICSGGRYDRLIKTSSGQELHSIGISIGLDRLFAAMESESLLPALKPSVDVLIVNFGADYYAGYLSFALRLRAIGLKVEIFSQPAKLAKQMKTANSKKVSFVVLHGEDESTRGEVVIKNMLTGEQRAEKIINLEDSFRL